MISTGDLTGGIPNPEGAQSGSLTIEGEFGEEF